MASFTNRSHCVAWHSHVFNKTHSYVRHASFACVPCLIHTCEMTHSDVWHDIFIWWHEACIHVTWLIHVWDMTHSYVRHDSFICATWQIHVTYESRHRADFESQVSHSVACLIHMHGMIHSRVWHDSFICATWLIHMCDRTHPCDLQVKAHGMPWLVRHIVRHNSYMALLRKMTCNFAENDLQLLSNSNDTSLGTPHRYAWHDPFTEWGSHSYNVLNDWMVLTQFHGTPPLSGNHFFETVSTLCAGHSFANKAYRVPWPDAYES